MNTISDKSSDVNYYIINKNIKDQPTLLVKIEYKYPKLFQNIEYF